MSIKNDNRDSFKGISKTDDFEPVRSVVNVEHCIKKPFYYTESVNDKSASEIVKTVYPVYRHTSNESNNSIEPTSTTRLAERKKVN